VSVSLRAKGAWHGAALAMLCSVMLVGCGTTHQGALVPALFPAQQAAAAKDPTRVRLDLPERDQRFTNARLSHSVVRVELPIGRIVEAAGAAALAQEFAEVTSGPGTKEPQGVHLVLSDITADVRDELIYFIPLPYLWPSRVDVTLRLAFTARVLGPDGSTRWTRDYASGPELWVPRKASLLIGETVHDGIQRVVHELSMRLARQAAQDLRAWLEQERRRERVL
jgi:hypothetical protein